MRTFGLEQGEFLIALVSFTPYVALASVLVTILAVGLRAWPQTAIATVAAVLLLVPLAARATGKADASDSSADSVRNVLALNLYRGEASAREVVALIEDFDIHIACLSELTPGAARRLEEAGIRSLLPSRHLNTGRVADGTGVYTTGKIRALPGIAPGVGEVPMARARVSPAEHENLDVTSVHVRAPVTGVGAEQWEEGLRAMPSASSPGSQLLAGDFNATLDHGELRDLLETGFIDAADAVGSGLTPTWPVGRAFPPPLTIDHILVEEGVSVVSFSVVDVPRSDHSAVVAQLVFN